MFKKKGLPILLAGTWISLSEFARNEFLLKLYWTGHFENLRLIFPAEACQRINLGHLVCLPGQLYIFYRPGFPYVIQYLLPGLRALF